MKANTKTKGNIDEPKLAEIIQDVAAEFRSASETHAPMHSAHEGWSVILEEVDELWEQVRKKSKKRSTANMRKEALQIAAMAVRFYHDLL